MIVDFDPIAFALGPLEIRWYSLAYIAGFLLGRSYMIRLAETFARHSAISVKTIDDLFLYAVLGVIVGGRLGFVMIYWPQYYWQNPLEILLIWNGGMAFHGAVIGMGVAIWAITKRDGISLFALSDLVAAAAPIGLFLGRLANFINGELWGYPTQLPIGMIFPRIDLQPRHPTQLYEAGLEGAVLGFFLYYMIRKHHALASTGLITGLMLSGYGVGRIIVEFWRAEDAQIGLLLFDLSMGQWLSIPLVLFGIWCIYKARRPFANDF
ncbi:MAG: prolipoprotein diacylglyceryl transferase [Pseudomonadota bacterium]